MITATAETVICRHCNEPVTPWLGGWVTALPFGEGMVICRSARSAGAGRLHEPANTTQERTDG